MSDQHAAAAFAPATTTETPARGPQEFGTLWIKDENGVSQMIRVLQATPAKSPSAAPAAQSSPAASSILRAVIRPAAPGAGQTAIRRVQLQQPVSGTTAGTQSPLAQPIQRTHVVTGSPQMQRNGVGYTTASPHAVISRRQIVGGKRRVLPSTVSGPPTAEGTPSAIRRLILPNEPELEPRTPPPARPPAPSASASRAAFISPILDHSGARKRQAHDPDLWSDSKRRRTDKNNKGLRHFSMKVCEKVRTKGKTTYNEVADELVAEFIEPGRCESPSEQQYDQKNIRRRVYDALNVLMAMNIISKEKKEIKWLGLPTNSLQECRELEREKAMRMHRINVKTQQLKDLILQQIAFKNLVERNKRGEELHGPPASNSVVQLPFIIVNTNKKTVIDCSISNDKTEYLFNFDDTFEIHDDIEVLKRMGMALGLENGTCSEEDVEKAKSMVPPSLASYIDQLSRDDGGSAELSADALEAADGVGSGTSASDRPQSLTPSIDFDCESEEEEEEEDEEDDTVEVEEDEQ